MKVYGVDGQREMDDQLARTKNTMFDLAATVAELRINVRDLETEVAEWKQAARAEADEVDQRGKNNAMLRHRLDSLRPILERMGHVFTDAAELGLPDGVKGIDGTWQVTE